MNFVAIDVETANADMASICQVGLAEYKDGVLSREWKSYIDPEDFFDEVNVSIHGINEATVKGAPKFPEILSTLNSYMDGAVTVSHTHFDRVAVLQTAARYDIQIPTSTWLDSARVARRAWEQFAQKGYGLGPVCKFIGYEFKHHDALEDAKAAAQVLLAAHKKCGLDIAGWLKRVGQPINPEVGSSQEAIKRDGNSEGPLHGEVLVFTGALEIPRREAADMAATVGCQVGLGVTKKTTFLVVGDQDAKRLAGHEKSSKHRKAEKLIQQGASIRILRESDFKELVRTSKTSIA